MGWDERNRQLAEALTLHEASLCSCGHPIGTAWDADSDGWWTAEETTCQACAAIEHHQKQQKEPTPGVRVRAVLDLNGWRESQARRKPGRA